MLAMASQETRTGSAPDRYYRAFRAHDARFDGQVYVGVTSTGIYCRPVCRVRMPRRSNCRFFTRPAAAEQAGFRPCLRCRPELAPGLSWQDSSKTLAGQAAVLIERAAVVGDDPYLTDIARQLGVTERHLRRIFVAVHGVSPIDFLTTRRLLLAKQLLTDTAMPVTGVALASGFGSIRRFNAVFADRYRMTPSSLRRHRPSHTQVGDAIADELVAVRLAYRPPYDVAGMLAFLAVRAVPGVEVASGGILRRTLALTHQGRRLQGWVSLRFVPGRHEVELAMAPELAPATGLLLAQARQALDLDADPAVIDPVIATVPVPGHVPPVSGIRMAGSMDGFEAAVRTILGQQVSIAAARTLAHRLVQRFGAGIRTPHADLHHLFPDAPTLAAASPDSLGTLGIVRQRVRAVQALAAEVAAGRLKLHRGAPLDASMAALRALPGVGAWTAELIAMRVFAWPDAFPASDIGVLNALGTRDPRKASAAAEAWRPWRAYAVARLWQSLVVPTDCRQPIRPIPSEAFHGERQMPRNTVHRPRFAGHDLAAQARLDSPLGPLTACATDKGLVGLWFDGQAHHPGALAAPVNPRHPVLLQLAGELKAYWRDGQTRFTVPLDLKGTPFQRSVWNALRRIPPGHTSTYAAIAARLGGKRMSRAVGAAVGRNPASIVVPCHRVLGSDGTLTGYAGGLERKRAMLRREGVAAG